MKKLIEELSCVSKSKIFSYLDYKYEWLGTGTSRKVYAINDKYVLKVAHNERGFSQNKAEQKISDKFPEHVARVKYYRDDYLWLISERAIKEDGRHYCGDGKYKNLREKVGIFEMEMGVLVRNGKNVKVIIDYGMDLKTIKLYGY